MKCYPIEERDGYAIICLLIFVIHQLSLLTQLKNHDCCCDSWCAWPPTPLHTQEGILRQHIGTFSKSTLVTVSYEKSHAGIIAKESVLEVLDRRTDHGLNIAECLHFKKRQKDKKRENCCLLPHKLCRSATLGVGVLLSISEAILLGCV